MKKIFSLIAGFLLLTFSARAVEGMWIPSLIDMFYSDMKTYGLKLSAEEVYSTNHSSMKDAVIQFGGGCTAEIVSDQGLILTNHHCGFDAIQKHSSLEHDYLKNGFWAKSQADELPCPWLKVTFVKEIKDVTAIVLEGVTTAMSAEERAKKIDENIKKAEKEAATSGSIQAKIKEFNLGNQYYMLVTEDYSDVRLVGAPPSAIGKFGGDTDNWVWPRHTGDFSVFRIYAGADNVSAEYNADNQPFKPVHSFPISLKPKQKGDFTMVYGFPGHTDQHYISGKLKFYMEVERPARIKMRQSSLDIIKPAMAADDLTRIQYASKQASIANAWKKWIGQLGGLQELDAVNVKKRWEEEYMAKAGEHSEWKAKYYNVINDLNDLQAKYGKYEFARAMFIEYFYVGPEFIQHAFNYYILANKYDQLEADGKLSEELEKLKKQSESFHKNYNKEVDRKIYVALSDLYANYVDAELLPLGFKDTWAEQEAAIFDKSIIMDPEAAKTMLSGFSKKSLKKLQNDPALKLATSLYSTYLNKVNGSYQKFVVEEDKLMQRYVEGILVMFPEKKNWADANSTLRIAFGKIEGSAPYDGMMYTHYTTIDGIIQKHATGNPDFELTDRFFELYEKGDWGGYDQDGDLWTCFTASNHTTGGNSGSPVIDAEGNLIGINFDRSWESTMSDFMFDESRCRNIVVDIRYVLWVIDKYGEAPHLVKEMNLVR
ncbi:MAG: S46 family peptidase [Crocinitomicaceae bacterium]|nr:S46 family peptidase [Crocinitomicaceae bacterium]